VEHDSCCTSLRVTGGTYFRTYGNTAGKVTGEADPAAVSDFRLDKYNVTVGRFRQFVTAWRAGYMPPAGSGKHTHLNGGAGLADSARSGTWEIGWNPADNVHIAPTDTNLINCGRSSWEKSPWTTSAGSQEALPITCVNWWEAYAFCIWDGGFLTSEAEWGYAAAGGAEQRPYAWGDMAPGTSNEYAIYDCNYPDGSGDCTGLGNIAPVGAPAKGAGRWGQLELMGSVWQWNLDWYASKLPNPCIDCAYLSGGSDRMDRGADYEEPLSGLHPATRGSASYDPPSYRGDNGFRCARSPSIE
jgi:formylglycine-generating enzyme required for sulfatase activity